MAQWKNRGRVARVSLLLERGSERAANRAARILKDALVAKLNQPGSGRTYTRDGRVHQASAPGEPPARETGELQGSVVITSKVTPGGASARVVVRDPKAATLELGTRYMAARPFVGPVLRDKKKNMSITITQTLRRALARL